MSALCQLNTTHLLFSTCRAEYIISPFHTHTHTRTPPQTQRDGAEVWVGREVETGKISSGKKKKKGEERVEEVLNQETERSGH